MRKDLEKRHMNSGAKTGKSAFSSIVGGVVATLAMSLTLLVFPTGLNPGLPILLGGVVSIVVGLTRAVKGLSRYYRPEVDIATGLLVWMAACTLLSLDAYLSQRSLASFAVGVAFLMLCPAVIKTRAQWRGLAYTLLGIISLASLLAWALAVIQASSTGVLPPLRGVFANHDTFAVLPLAGLCLAMGLVEKSGPRLTWFNLLLAAFFLFTLFGTGCRAALVGFVAAALFFFLSLHFLRSEKSEKTRLFVGFPLILALLATPVVGYQFAAGAKWSRLADGSALKYQEMRFELLENGWKAIAANPVFGSGPGAFGQAYQTVRPPGHNELYVNIAHNDFLEMGVENGVLGLLLWLGLTWFGLTIPWSHLKKGRRPTEAAGVLAAVLALAVFSLFNFIVVQRPALWVQMWIFGLAFSFPNNRKRWEEPTALRLAGGLLLIGFGLWCGLWGYRSLQAEAFYLQARRAERRLDLEDSLQFYQQAAALQPPRYDRTLRQVALLEKLRLFGDVDNLDTQLKLLEEAREANPVRTQLLLKLAEVQQKSGQVDQARATFDQALKAAPYERPAFAKRLSFLVEQGELEAAARSLAEHSYRRWSENADKFPGVLLALIQTDPETGKKILAEWLGEHPDDRGFLLPEKTASLARKAKDWKAEQAVISVWKSAQPDNLCLEENYALALGRQKGEEIEFQYLSSILEKSTDNAELCFSKLLERWSILGLRQGQSRAVEARLREFLELVPYRHWARTTLARTLAERENFTEAVSLLREGLDKNPNEAELLMALGDVFEAQGSIELAINYYREVTRRNEKNKKAQSRLKALLNKM